MEKGNYGSAYHLLEPVVAKLTFRYQTSQNFLLFEVNEELAIFKFTAWYVPPLAPGSKKKTID